MLNVGSRCGPGPGGRLRPATTDAAGKSFQAVAEHSPKQRLDVSIHTLDGETLVLDRAAEQIHQLNRTASFIWAQCDGRRTVSEIVAELARCFDVNHETAREAVQTTLRQLHDLGLVG